MTGNRLQKAESTKKETTKKDVTEKEVSSTKRLTGFTLVSVHSMIICLLILVSFCFAWFTEVVNGPSFMIASASYGIEAEVSGNGAVTDGDNTSFEVENGKTYDICLTATGDASRGFCIVSAGDVIYHTAPILKGGQLSFRIIFPGNGTRTVELVPYWGEYRDEISAGDIVFDKDTISGNH